MGDIPTLLIHGSLGSGKTTLIKQLLKDERFADSLIIENEFASEDIDSQTLDEAHRHGKKFSITGGCVCCSSAEELEETLAQVAVLNWDKPVIIETTGVASSASLLQKLFLNSTFLEHFAILQNIYVVDPLEVTPQQLRGSHRLEVALADMVVINKSSLAGSQKVKSLLSALKSVNPAADIRATDHGHVTLANDKGWSNVERALTEEHEALQAYMPQLNHELSYVVREMIWPMTKLAFTQAMRRLANSSELSRCKGYFYEPDGTWWHYEATSHHQEFTPTSPKMKATIVYIGKKIDSKRLDAAGFTEAGHGA